ncbi:MAG: hypothetical protein ACN6PL_06080 [Pseudomonas putida]
MPLTLRNNRRPGLLQNLHECDPARVVFTAAGSVYDGRMIFRRAGGAALALPQGVKA